MEDVLHKIVAHKRAELENYNFGDIEQQALNIKRPVISMSQSLKNSKKGGIIAEFKRRSPSKGWINMDADPTDVVANYAKCGAAACSVLTNEEFFGGSLQHLIKAREVAVDTPLLCKEFIIDSRQIYQARVAGADAILLIAACLSVDECKDLAQIAKSIGLEVLLEIHSEEELKHVNSYIDMLGVNNRNLGTFVTDVNNSFNLVDKIKELGGDFVLVSESGIESAETINRLREVGFRGFLIGETLMKGGTPFLSLTTLIEGIC